MKLKNILLFTAPVALAGFMFLGEAVGINQVFAKRVAQKGNYIDWTYTVGLNGLGKDYEDEFYYYIYVAPYSISREKFEIYEKIYIEVEEESDDKVTPAVDPEAEEARRREAAAIEEQNAKRREEAAIEVQKAAEKKTEDFTKEITTSIEQAIKNLTVQTSQNNSNSVENAVIKTDYFTCFTQDMIDLLAANPDLNYEIHYRYKGKRYVVVIPAGTDYSKLEASNGYYGFRYLDSIFGGYEEGTK